MYLDASNVIYDKKKIFIKSSLKTITVWKMVLFRKCLNALILSLCFRTNYDFRVLCHQKLTQYNKPNDHKHTPTSTFRPRVRVFCWGVKVPNYEGKKSNEISRKVVISKSFSKNWLLKRQKSSLETALKHQMPVNTFRRKACNRPPPEENRAIELPSEP